jgi:hypothetical protein
MSGLYTDKRNLRTSASRLRISCRNEPSEGCHGRPNLSENGQHQNEKRRSPAVSRAKISTASCKGWRRGGALFPVRVACCVLSQRPSRYPYSALSRAASCDSAMAEQQGQHFKALAEHYKQLALWAENCRENFENRAALVGAEIARIEGRDLDAMRLYEQAVGSAHANGFVNNEAVANEVAPWFYAARDFEKIAHAYLRDARYCYLRWGSRW